jgi:FAD/FMN-containing dehydrogenase
MLTPDHPDYDRYRRVWNGLADKRPAAIVRARTVDDVRRAVRAAAASRSLLAVRGGGHSLPGLSTCDGGLVLDLSLLNAISIDFDAGTAEVGGGALLGDLDRATIPHGLIVPAGVVSHTGVAGLTLGGGMGWAGRKYGLTIDSLLGAELVTASGEVIWTDAASDPELFWGIRGGGGNFGVVTRFLFRTHPFEPVVVGKWSYPLSAAPQALRTLRDLARDQPRELTVAFTVSGGELGLAATWFGEPAAAERMLAPFGPLAGKGDGGIENMPYLELQSRSDEHYAWSRRYYAKGGFWSDISDQAIEQVAKLIASAPTPDCEIYVLQLGGSIADIAEDATAYSGRGAAYYWLVEPVWDNPDDDEECLAWGRASAASLADASIQANYVNEQGDADAGVALAAYGEEKYRRLARLKARMDTDNLFRLNQNIKPLV